MLEKEYKMPGNRSLAQCLVIEATELFVPAVLLDESSKRYLGVLCNILILANILLSLKLSSNKIVIS